MMMMSQNNLEEMNTVQQGEAKVQKWDFLMKLLSSPGNGREC
jgi:hypothetical protein